MFRRILNSSKFAKYKLYIHVQLMKIIVCVGWSVGRVDQENPSSWTANIDTFMGVVNLVPN